MEALEMLGRANVNQMPVMAGAKLQGLISRDHTLRLLAMRQELDM